MTIHGHIEDGRVVIPERVSLPDGTPVEVVIVEGTKESCKPEGVPSLSELVGSLPEDLDSNEYHESRIRGRS